MLGSQALETPQLDFRELNDPHLPRNPLNLTWLCTTASWNLLRNTAEPCWTWPGSAPKPPRPSSKPSPQPCWTWPGSAPKPPRTLSGTFSGTLLNLTWLCTKASHTFSGTFSGTKASETFSETFSETLLNLTWLCTKASQAFSGNHWTWLGFAPWLPGTFFGTFSGTLSVEPDLALHQSLQTFSGNLRDDQTFSGTFSGTVLNLTRLCAKASRNLLRNLLRNPVEPDLALHQDLLRNLLWDPVEPDLPMHQSLPDLLPNRLRNPVEPDLALHQSLRDLLRNLLRNPVELDPALHQSLPDLLRNLLWAFSGTFSGTLLDLTWLCTKASWNLLRDLLRNPVEPELALHQSLPDLAPRPSREPSPEPRWTGPGACTSAHQSFSGLKTPLAYAVGEKRLKPS